MSAARWGSFVVALLLLTPSPGALAKDTDGAVLRTQGAAPYDGNGYQGRNWGYRDGRSDRRGRDLAFENGFSDGYEKGIDDGHDRRSFDPTRHKWYRNADRHYESRYGSRARYENLYRDGFRSGYQAGYSDGGRYDNRRTNRFPRPY